MLIVAFTSSCVRKRGLERNDLDKEVRIDSYTMVHSRGKEEARKHSETTRTHPGN